MSNQVYKKYFLYTALSVTFGATAYFRYQDGLEANAYEIAVVAKDPKLIKNSSNEDRYVGVENEFLAKVDIFEVNKKPGREAIRQDIVPLNTIKKSTPVPVAEFSQPLPPQAPPIPFKYIGKIFGDEEFQVFLGFNGKSIVVKEGDTIQQTYKVEKITSPVMTLTYIPMSILQNMQIGEPN